MDTVAVFGIGSTNFRYATAATDGRLLSDPRVEPTRPRELPAQVLDALADISGDASGVDGVAVSVAGLVDAAAGVVREFDTPAGETVDRIDLGSHVAATRDLPLALANDCNAAALGEWYFGARDDERCLAHLTVGTGIGGGVVEDGRLVRGESGAAGEFGLLSLDPTADLDSCGVAGAWEAFCSGRGIPRFVAHRRRETGADTSLPADENLTAEAVFDAAADGDAFAADCLDRLARYNAAGVGAVCNAVEPGLVTLGGGVALNNAAWLRESLDEHLADFCFVERPAIRVTGLGDDVGLYGALATYRAQASPEPARGGAESTEGATD
jgi:glucokinase